MDHCEKREYAAAVWLQVARTQLVFTNKKKYIYIQPETQRKQVQKERDPTPPEIDMCTGVHRVPSCKGPKGTVEKTSEYRNIALKKMSNRLTSHLTPKLTVDPQIRASALKRHLANFESAWHSLGGEKSK
jgi:hypothetical protein